MHIIGKVLLSGLGQSNICLLATAENVSSALASVGSTRSTSRPESPRRLRIHPSAELSGLGALKAAGLRAFCTVCASLELRRCEDVGAQHV